LRFWDSSAVVPLLLGEPATRALQALYAADPVMAVWWATEVECESAICRLERARRVAPDAARKARGRLAALTAAWVEISPVGDLREAAVRFLRVHDLRAGDALQLAAAYLAAERRPVTLDFVCRDERLCRAAEREGFPLP
jgi:uncharacterized protein